MVVGGAETRGAGGELADLALLLLHTTVGVLVTGVAVATTAAAFGSEKSCFRTEVGVWLAAREGGAGADEEAEVGVWMLWAGPGAVCSMWVGPGLEAPPPLCFGDPLALPGLTGRTGNGPHVLGEGAKVPPNCAMGRRGCLICCMV